MTMTHEETISIMDDVNIFIHEHLDDDDEEYQLSYESNGSSARILFMGIPLWDDQDNEREWLGDHSGDNEGEYITLEAHLKDRLGAVLGNVALISAAMDKFPQAANPHS